MGEGINISVLMSVYNGERYLAEAIESILAQRFDSFEFLIINDGSTDSSREIIHSYDDPRIRLENNEGNKGLVYCLNKGLNLARGKYIARMDCDDIALPDRLGKQFAFMEANPQTGICGTWFKAFDKQTGWKRTVRFPVKDAAIRAFMFTQSPFCHPCVMMRKDLFETCGLKYPSEYYRAEDYGLWIELLNYTHGHNLPEVLLDYRYHETNETKLAEKQLLERNTTLRQIQKKHLELLDIHLESDSASFYFDFVNRSIPCTFSVREQEEIALAIQEILSGLNNGKKAVRPEYEKIMAKTCFYRFYSFRSYPKNKYLKNLYWKGFFRYIVSIMKKQ